MKTLSPERIRPDGVIEKYCGGKGGCDTYHIRDEHFSKKTVYPRENVRYLSVCGKKYRSQQRKNAMARLEKKLKKLPEKREFQLIVDLNALPWTANLKKASIVTGIFGTP
jgi:hypothetical protein